jgi:thioredoxin 1
MKKPIIISLLLFACFIAALAGHKNKKIEIRVTRGQQFHLLELGSNSCTSCIAMNQVLDELKSDYPEVLSIEKMDVFKNKDLIHKYSLKVIPTQIFYTSTGKELFRNEGFISAKEMMLKIKKHNLK